MRWGPSLALAVCPPQFSFLEEHAGDAEHGDVCRNPIFGGYNAGWACPNGCAAADGGVAAPWCVAAGARGGPCRAGREARPKAKRTSPRCWDAATGLYSTLCCAKESTCFGAAHFRERCAACCFTAPPRKTPERSVRSCSNA